MDTNKRNSRNSIGPQNHLTFKGNGPSTRHSWLRLTPAHAAGLVSDLLDRHHQPGSIVLDPFCGTGSTALVCAERGIDCDTIDINPLLVWLAQVKTRSYSPADVELFRNATRKVSGTIHRAKREPPWTPDLYNIARWWSRPTRIALGRAMSVITTGERAHPSPATDLLKVAFCRTLIQCANVSFGHQSMSLKKTPPPQDEEECERLVATAWAQNATLVADSAASRILVSPSVVQCDARDLGAALKENEYGCVITSPPYPNRISYVRELRPYMYWLGYLRNRSDAGELDWRAIGGTWGRANSRIEKWKPPTARAVPFDGFAEIVAKIQAQSAKLGNYVWKYFYDMVQHCESLFTVVEPGGSVHYVVGNSKFFEVVVPVERIYAAMFANAGFTNVSIETIRKRSSKKELFEFIVSGRKPV